MFLIVIIVQVVVELPLLAWIGIIVVGVASMYLVDQICLKKGCALRKKYQK